ncbi:MAG: hypothetical protein R3C52_01160 [Hyphomonadaceae bacterium]
MTRPAAQTRTFGPGDAVIGAPPLSNDMHAKRASAAPTREDDARFFIDPWLSITALALVCVLLAMSAEVGWFRGYNAAGLAWPMLVWFAIVTAGGAGISAIALRPPYVQRRMTFHGRLYRRPGWLVWAIALSHVSGVLLVWMAWTLPLTPRWMREDMSLGGVQAVLMAAGLAMLALSEGPRIWLRRRARQDRNRPTPRARGGVSPTP